METLTQVQIIRSLGEALAWFEKELEWGADPAELRHLTGRIGELYAAMITRGQMAPRTNQRGYDVVSADGERISVKTVTRSAHVTFNARTFHEAHRVIVLRINMDDDAGLSIETIHDLSIEETRVLAETSKGALRVALAAGPRVPVRLDALRVTDRASFGPHELSRYENGTVVVRRDGQEVAPAKPVLREIAAAVGVDILNGAGGMKNTRTLGQHVIQAVNARSPEGAAGR